METSDSDYIVWLDADIMIVEHNISIESIIEQNMDGKELTKYVIARARAQFIDGKTIKSMEMATTIDKEIKMNLIRLLAISAFNCLISVLICTQTEAKLYKAFLFDSNPSKVI